MALAPSPVPKIHDHPLANITPYDGPLGEAKLVKYGCDT